MTRSKFFKSLGALVGIAVLSPLELLKGRARMMRVKLGGDIVVNDGNKTWKLNLPILNSSDANKVRVTDGYGNCEWVRHPDEVSESENFKKWKEIYFKSCTKPEGEMWDSNDVILERRKLRRMKESGMYKFFNVKS